MSQSKEFMQAVPIFVALVSWGLMGFIPPLFALSSISCTKTVKQCQTCPNGTFADINIAECRDCFMCNRSGQCTDSRKCRLRQPGSYQNKAAETSWKLCGIGTYCSTRNCTVCSACPKDHEAKSQGCCNCTECEKGHFKGHDNSELCRKCSAGSFANMTGQTVCIKCPGGYFCPAGAVEPKRCENAQVCPPGSGSPEECEPPWHYKKGNECVLSTALIVVIAVIIIPIALAVIIVIIYKLYKYCKWRQHQEFLRGEREPLLPGSRPSSRIEEPVYTGL